MNKAARATDFVSVALAVRIIVGTSIAAAIIAYAMASVRGPLYKPLMSSQPTTCPSSSETQVQPEFDQRNS